MFRGHLVLTTRLYRRGAKRDKVIGPRPHRKEGAERSLPDPSRCSTFSTFLKDVILHILTFLLALITTLFLMTYWIKTPLLCSPTFILMFRLATPKCILHSSWGSPCIISLFLHACCLVYRQYVFAEETGEWMNKWVVFDLDVELPRNGISSHHLDKPHFQYKSKFKISFSWNFPNDSSPYGPLFS